MSILLNTSFPHSRPSELRVDDLTHRHTPSYTPLVPLPECDFYVECATAQRLLALRQLIEDCDSQEAIEQYRTICSKDLSPEELEHQLQRDLSLIRVNMILKRSALGLTAGVYFVESNKSTNFVLKWIPRAEARANARYQTALEAMGDSHLKMPEWRVMNAARCVLDLGPIPEAYNPNNCTLCVFAKAPGMPLGSFMLHCYSSLSQQQKKQFFTLLTKTALLDALVGNEDRLYKVYRRSPSNLGNVLVQSVDEKNNEITMFLIDNSSDLSKNLFPPQKYKTQQKNFFDQMIAQIASALPSYCVNASVTFSEGELQALQKTFRDDAAAMRDEILSLWNTSLRQLAKKTDSTNPGILDIIVAKQLKRIIGVQPKRLSPETPLQNRSFRLSPPETPDTSTGDSSSGQTNQSWVQAIEELAASNGAPETREKIVFLNSKGPVGQSPTVPPEVSALVSLVRQMSNNRQSYDPNLGRSARDARRALRVSNRKMPSRTFK